MNSNCITCDTPRRFGDGGDNYQCGKCWRSVLGPNHLSGPRARKMSDSPYYVATVLAVVVALLAAGFCAFTLGFMSGW